MIVQKETWSILNVPLIAEDCHENETKIQLLIARMHAISKLLI